jgi:hypothetical protein
MSKIFPKLLAFLPWFLWLAVTTDAALAQMVRASESRRKRRKWSVFTRRRPES